MKIFQSNYYLGLGLRIFILPTTHLEISDLWCLTPWDGISFSYFLSFSTREPHHYLSHSGPDTASWPSLGDRLFFPWEDFHVPEENWSPLCQGFYPVKRTLQAIWVERLVLGHCVKSKKFYFWSKYLKITLFLVWPPCSS